LLLFFQREWSSKSDAWSFGVTVWEIFALCTAPPYPHLDDDEVEDSLEDVGVSRDAYGDAASLGLNLVPPELPAEARALVATCFRRRPEERPGFADLHRALATAVSNMASTFR
jgi:hypothetical protein